MWLTSCRRRSAASAASGRRAGRGATGMPELPEVQALVSFLAEKATGQVIERAELVAFAALKTFDPPLEALAGRTIVGTGRHGKFLDFDVSTAGDPMHLVFHLARGGWVRWNDSLPAGR